MEQVPCPAPAPHDARASGHAANTWLLSGLPRAGTSLCCRLAGELPNVVALAEPLNGPTLAQADAPAAAADAVAAFAGAARARILAEGRAPTLHVAGQLSDDLVQPPSRTGAGLRRPQAERGEVSIDKQLAGGFILLIKQNALFAALLPVLAPRFRCLALLRNPIAVLASWQTVRLPVQRGRLPAGERFDAGLRARLDAEPSLLRRQLAILDWFCAQYRAHLPEDAILRYEDLVASGGQALFERLGAVGEGRPLRARTTAPAAAVLAAALSALENDDGAWRHFYALGEVQAAAAAIRRTCA